jgi:hypothetical protein
VELAKGNSGYQQNNFIKIGEVASRGNSSTEQQYSFTDKELNKSGVRYYRLKIVDKDGSFDYSAIRPVVFGNEIKWNLFPNPSEGKFNLSFQLNEGEVMRLKVYDLNGRLVKQLNAEASGFIQKISIDLQDPHYASGLYFVEASAGERKESFRIVKQ